MMYHNLIKHISKYIPLDDHSIEMLHSCFKSVTYKKKEFLLKENEVCRYLHFVEKGCLRMYFINNKGSEQITQFAIENWWIADYFSFIEKKPSEYYIQAVETSEILSVDTVLLEELLHQLPAMERYLRLVMQRALAASQLRLKYMYELSKEEFYMHFSTSFPEFVQRVPQYMIASYLGLTPEYVSELRKKNT